MERVSMRSSSTDSGTNLIVNMPESARPASRRASIWSGIMMVLLSLCVIGLMSVLVIRVQQVQDNLFVHHKQLISLSEQQEVLKRKLQEIGVAGSNPKSARLSANGVRQTLSSSEKSSPTEANKALGFKETRMTRRVLNLTGFGQNSHGREMIHVVGKGNSYSEIQPGEPIHHWKVHVQEGQISLDVGSHIVVKVPGLYFIYSQVQFYLQRLNAQSTRSVVYSVIRNRGESVLKSIVPLKNCVTTCTRYHASLVRLDVGDRLSVQVFQKIKIVTRETVTYFGAFLLVPL